MAWGGWHGGGSHGLWLGPLWWPTLSSSPPCALPPCWDEVQAAAAIASVVRTPGPKGRERVLVAWNGFPLSGEQDRGVSVNTDNLGWPSLALIWLFTSFPLPAVNHWALLCGAAPAAPERCMPSQAAETLLKNLSKDQTRSFLKCLLRKLVFRHMDL